MLQTVRDACELHGMALDYAMGDQVEHLSDLLDGAEKSSGDFFDKNFVTAGMRVLLRQGLERLAGRSDQAVFELKQAMGGGKTHSMLALGLLARNPELRDRVPNDITAGLPATKARVVAINGRSVSRDTFLWGDIAAQVGKPDLFAKFWKNGADAPGEADWIDLFGETPTLLLLDELPPYFDYAITRPVGGGTLANVTNYALSNLLSAALKLKQLCIVISNLSGAYQGASKDLTKAIGNFRQETNRQARAITPVELASNEIYEILRKRLFKRIGGDGVIDSVAGAYAEALSEAVKSKAVAKPTEQIEEEVRRSYPFHPSVKHVIAMFKENESYRQTRGLMQFASKMIKSVWGRKTNDVYLIGCQHLDLGIPDVREELNRISNLQAAVSTDIADNDAAHAETIDANAGNDAAGQVARLLLTASLSESVDAVKGLTKSQVLEVLVAPHRTALEFDTAFEDLRQECWYLHRKENDAWYFSNIENLKKRIENRAATAPQPKIDAEMKRRLEAIFEAKERVAYQRVLALPKLDEIDTKGMRLCLVLSPDSKNPPADAMALYNDRVEKNNFCVVTGDGSSLGNLEEKVRRIWAVAKVREEIGEKSVHVKELQEEADTAEFDFHSTVVSLFNRVWYPAKAGLIYAKLQIEPTKAPLDHSVKKVTLDGEGSVRKALSATGASKLEPAITEVNLDALLLRAEEQLWSGSEKRIPWKDVTSRAATNPRWTWLPPKALDELRTKAMGQDRWRFTDDGYIEKGPFPPPKTSVKIQERAYEEVTGKATLGVTAKDAGPHGRVHVSKTPEVTPGSEHVMDEVFETDATVLYFVAIDPDGKHATGEVTRWTNRLTITHERREQLGKRIVELTVVPRGALRWNMTGVNPKEGTSYGGPIDLPGDDDVTLYVYAEHDGVTATREFTIPRPSQKGTVIDKQKPATLKKKLSSDGNGPAFTTIKCAKDAKASFVGISIEVGKGSKNALTRFGSESRLAAESIERFIMAARSALGDDTADVKITFNAVHFPTGHDLEVFLKGMTLDVAPTEVEQ
ncbi:MAG: anti-phage-associated DUF499 domain-containing protein [Myxococcota bacterium]